MVATMIAVTPRTTLGRKPSRGTHEEAKIHAILDEALVCHVGFVDGGQPYVIPTLHVRVGDALYLHGSQRSRMLGALRAGAPVCVTVTLMDGLVLARSAMHHSMNYRSVVVLGTAEEVRDREEKLRVLEALVEHVARGRSRETRAPDEGELQATAVVRIPITEASAKVREGPPVDLEEDYALPFWAGVVPLRLEVRPPVADPRLRPETPMSDAVIALLRAGST
jgi:uncharacterized protein